jgi:RHS repeat-associated protein
LHDDLGNVRQLADASGNIVQSYTYAPFGELLAAQGTRSSALQYSGEQKDVDTGLVYLRARWYDSATGRFTTRDPFPGFAALPQTLHPYVYVNNNPVNLTDPSGEIPIETLLDIVVFAVDIGIYVWDAINPALDDCTRKFLLGIDLAALGADGLALVIPYLPGGGGLAGRLAGRGLLVFAQSGARASAGLRIIQIGAKAAQSSAYLARTGGRGGGTRGSVGGGGRSSYRSIQDAQREIENWKVPDNLSRSDDWHLDAARRELQGEVFPNSKPLGHYHEVIGARRGLSQALDRIQGALRSGGWSSEARQFLLEQQTLIDERLKHVQRVLGH